METTTSQQLRLRRLVLLTWVMVTFFYFYLSWDYISVTSTDKKFGEYLEYIVQLAGTERRPPKEVRTLILVKADELGLPLAPDQVAISGLGQTLAVDLTYDVDVEFPGLERVLYKKNFQHTIRYHQPR
jgi:hypothetical protein